ncbi:MAG: phosphotransferase enzyme family protein [Gammaproteobacteria bacterium]
MTGQNPTTAQARQALAAYPLTATGLTRLDSGLINRTFSVQSNIGEEFILQAVNPMFTAETLADIGHITHYLQQAGLPTPQLIRTRDGQLFTRQGQHLWRLYNRVAGETRQTLHSPAAAESAGALLAGMHQALTRMDYTLQFSRPGVHNTARHIRHLHDSLDNCRTHPSQHLIRPLAQDILHGYQALTTLPLVAPRLVHGDPKISNFIYQPGTDTALCMVDFDTFSYMPLYLEIGDALRSWCNPVGEDDADGGFDRDLALAALSGYAANSGEFILSAEWHHILPATEQVYLELAARFCADALNEDYFGWDSTRFASHSEHSQVRARGQLSAAESLRRQSASLQPLLEELFSS